MKKLVFLIFGIMLLFFGCTDIIDQFSGGNVLTISEVNQDLNSYIGKEVTVEGYLGHKAHHGAAGYHILIEDYEQFFIKEVLPQYTYLLVDDSSNPLGEEYEGKNLRIKGTISEYDGYSLTPVAVITADSITEING